MSPQPRIEQDLEVVDIGLEDLEDSVKKKAENALKNKFNLTFSSKNGVLRPPGSSNERLDESSVYDYRPSNTPLKRIVANLSKNDDDDDIDVEWAHNP